jgi:hypothetical protein
MCICCEEKRVRIRHAQQVFDLLDIARDRLAGMDRDSLEDHNCTSFLLREAAFLVAEANLDLSIAKAQATEKIEEALGLCDSCGKWAGKYHYWKYGICVVCFIADGQSAISRLEHAARLNQVAVA